MRRGIESFIDDKRNYNNVKNDSKFAEGFDSEFENMWNYTKDYEDYN